MLNNIVRVLLEFSHEVVIIPVIIIGFIWFSRDIFYHGTCLVLLTMLLSFVLKSLFQKTSSYGFAFPSGHMQVSAVLYGWLACNFKNYLFRGIIALLLSGIGFSLVYSGYHDHYDVLGGVFFAVITLCGYYFFLQKFRHNILYLILGAASLLMLYIYSIADQITPHLWMAYYALIGFITSYKILGQNIRLNKVITTVLCFLIVFVIQRVFQLSFLSGLPIYLSQLQWLLIGCSVPFSDYITNILKIRIQNAS